MELPIRDCLIPVPIGWYNLYSDDFLNNVIDLIL